MDGDGNKGKLRLEMRDITGANSDEKSGLESEGLEGIDLRAELVHYVSEKR